MILQFYANLNYVSFFKVNFNVLDLFILLMDISTAFIHIKARLIYTQGLKYMPDRVVE